MTVSSNLNPQFAQKNSFRLLLIIEAFTLYRYLLGAKPSMALVRRYVRCIEYLKSGAPLEIPKIFITFPHLLFMLDRNNLDNALFQGELYWRINSASFICESSIYGAAIYLKVNQKQDVIGSAYGLLKAGIFELIARISCGLFKYPLRFHFALRKQTF